MICLVIPAYNEEKIIRACLLQLLDMLDTYDLPKTTIVVANNGSTDNTKEEIDSINDDRVKQIIVVDPGKGQAIKEGFLSCEADVYAFMDADLATDISAFPQLIREIQNGFDIVIGSRALKDSHVDRSALRHFLSKRYSQTIRHYFQVPVTDFPCGFKAFSKKVIKEVMGEVENMHWFFDPEFLIRSYIKGFSIKEIPITWKEEGIEKDRISKLNLVSDAIACFKEMRRLKSRLS